MPEVSNSDVKNAFEVKNEYIFNKLIKIKPSNENLYYYYLLKDDHENVKKVTKNFEIKKEMYKYLYRDLDYDISHDNNYILKYILHNKYIEEGKQTIKHKYK